LGREIWGEYPDLIGSSYETAFRQAAESGMASSATDFYTPRSVPGLMCGRSPATTVSSCRSATPPKRARFRTACRARQRMTSSPASSALVSDAAEAAGVCPSALNIELTETVVMSDVAAASRALSEVRRLGVTVSPDEFGTGYSSLAYLAGLPVDRIRMDKWFVQELTGKELASGTRGGRKQWSYSRAAHENRRGRYRDRAAIRPRQRTRLRCRAGILHWQAGIRGTHRTLR